MLLAKLRCFDDAVLNPLLLGVLDRLLVHYQLSVSTAIEIHPGEVAQTFHRDDGVYPLPPGFGPLTINSMWAITDFTARNGATRLMPSSHRGPAPTSAGSDDDGRSDDEGRHGEFVADMPAGSVLIYLGNLLHGGGANESPAPRLGVVLEYGVSWIRPQENLGLGYPPALARTLPTRLQELLGYNLYPPFLGYVDGMDPIELLR
jgi:ectoine hydroxylase-related dioxygenase (phytanoyl-CoA dioxygenase family)